MDDNLDDIEDIFYSSLNDNEEVPSPGAWNEVDKRLDKETVISIKKKYANLKKLAILLFLLLGFSVYELQRIYNSNRVVSTNTPLTTQKNNISNADNTSDKINSPDIALKSNSRSRRDETAEDVPTTLSGSIGSPEKPGKASTSTTLKQTTPEIDIVQKSRPNNKRLSGAMDVTSSRQTKGNSKGNMKLTIQNPAVVDDLLAVALSKNDTKQVQNIYVKNLPDAGSENGMMSSMDPVDKSLLNSTLITLNSRPGSNPSSYIEKNKSKIGESLSKFSMMPFFSPDIAWYHLQDGNTSNRATNANDLERAEKHEFSSTYGDLLNYQINRHWSIQSGITWSNTNIVSEPEIIYAQPDNTGSIKYRINTSSGYGYVLPSFSANPVAGDSLYAFTSTQSLQYFGVPVSAAYSIIKNKFTFSLRSGVSVNFLTRARLETSLEKGSDKSVETVNNIQGLKKMYFAGLAGVMGEYKLNRKISLVFAPTLRFALNPINKNAPVESFPMTFGSVAGIKFRL